jgi:hypothetical protein
MHKLQKKIPFTVLWILGVMIPTLIIARGTTNRDRENCAPGSSREVDALGNGIPKPKPRLESDNVVLNICFNLTTNHSHIPHKCK